ncbi:thioredoxin-dependent thiol peroxidase [Patulibacter sp.]|uniref:thioredoxin-dependent thiol peroxidase n=1 Tax=Patulibacter sp. TaxID=1912859 RepID=UPI0027247B4A|nr:thioredoxin-dependent thiol peroxidase [Patulibacter sp.]MDO9408637.1 thioredoxin-dependent thiol peroxidase [Patulibacter sp.]
MPLPETGQPAPDFTLPDAEGTPVTLSDLRGTWVVLYFYPKASTPGCTTQACSVRDHRADYESRGARVLGVSPDPVKKVASFVEKQALDFTLLADEDHEVCDLYGTWVEKSMYGKTYWGASRSTVIVDPEGVVAEVFPKVKPAEHDAKVLAALDALQGAATA